ncbi:DNA-binding protein [Nakamurella silvestris]|nr:DNA-binding protein [Nakamurella silvestris]
MSVNGAVGGTLVVVSTPNYVPLPDIAEALDLIITKAHQLIKDGQLIAVRRDGALRVPAEFVQDGLIVKSLPGTITLLRDAGFEDQEIIDWLFTEDEALPGTPIQALRENRGTEIKRRAQASGF